MFITVRKYDRINRPINYDFAVSRFRYTKFYETRRGQKIVLVSSRPLMDLNSCIIREERRLSLVEQQLYMNTHGTWAKTIDSTYREELREIPEEDLEKYDYDVYIPIGEY